MEINILTSTTGKQAVQSVEVTEEQFWKDYLKLLSVRNKFLTDKEIQVLAWVLARNDNLCYFSAPHKNTLLDEMDISEPELSRIKNALIEKGAVNLVRPEDDKRVRRAYPVKQLTSLRDYIHKSKQIKITFPYVFTTQ